MTFVVDTSVTMAWCFEDEASEAADAVLDRLAREGGRAPLLWRYEVSNVLLIAERRGRVSEFQVTNVLTQLLELPISLEETPASMETLLATGREHRLSSYDAAYLSLAVRQGIPLATLDKGLRKAALTAGVPLLIDSQ